MESTSFKTTKKAKSNLPSLKHRITNFSQSHQGVQLFWRYVPRKGSGGEKDPEHRIAPQWCYLPQGRSLPTSHACHCWQMILTTSYRSPHSAATAGPWSTCLLYTLFMDLQHDSPCGLLVFWVAWVAFENEWQPVVASYQYCSNLKGCMYIIVEEWPGFNLPHPPPLASQCQGWYYKMRNTVIPYTEHYFQSMHTEYSVWWSFKQYWL